MLAEEAFRKEPAARPSPVNPVNLRKFLRLFFMGWSIELSTNNPNIERY